MKLGQEEVPCISSRPLVSPPSNSLAPWQLKAGRTVGLGWCNVPPCRTASSSRDKIFFLSLQPVSHSQGTAWLYVQEVVFSPVFWVEGACGLNNHLTQALFAWRKARVTWEPLLGFPSCVSSQVKPSCPSCGRQTCREARWGKACGKCGGGGWESPTLLNGSLQCPHSPPPISSCWILLC